MTKKKKLHPLEAKYEEEAKLAKEEPQETNLEKLPNPTGWRILIMPFAQKEKTDGGIIIAQETLDRSPIFNT